MVLSAVLDTVLQQQKASMRTRHMLVDKVGFDAAFRPYLPDRETQIVKRNFAID